MANKAVPIVSLKSALKQPSRNVEEVGLPKISAHSGVQSRDNLVEANAKEENHQKAANKSPVKVASNVLKKKKTVAFGRTTNLSQTIEVNLSIRIYQF